MLFTKINTLSNIIQFLYRNEPKKEYVRADWKNKEEWVKEKGENLSQIWEISLTPQGYCTLQINRLISIRLNIDR